MANVDKTCEKCGKQFSCGESSDCWCAELPNLDEKKRQEIRDEYNDCLCEACLKAELKREAERR